MYITPDTENRPGCIEISVGNSHLICLVVMVFYHIIHSQNVQEIWWIYFKIYFDSETSHVSEHFICCTYYQISGKKNASSAYNRFWWKASCNVFTRLKSPSWHFFLYGLCSFSFCWLRWVDWVSSAFIHVARLCMFIYKLQQHRNECFF